jgi:signal transduction histidine kinase
MANIQELADSVHKIAATTKRAVWELEARAERIRALEETRAFIAHEFRHCLTPLNAYVKMLDEALTQPQDDKDKLLSLTARIRQQTDAAIELVERYLDYSRPLVPHFAKLSISDLLQQSLTEFGADLGKRSIVLRSGLAEDSNAEVDRQMVAQVLRNVIANAIQAMGQEGELTITSELRQEDVAITVRDSGGGIKPEHLAHVFEIGFTTKCNVRGAGLGLALCKRIIEEAHHGTIAIENTTDGTGATVLITLPKKQMEVHNGRQHLAPADC